MAFDYDAFVSHSREDAALVRTIVQRLTREAEVTLFLDEWCLLPDEPWPQDMDSILDRSATCVLFIGSGKTPPWTHPQMQSALVRRLGERMLRLIPVLLPGADKAQAKSQLPFLDSPVWVNYGSGPEDESVMATLRARIRGYWSGPPELEESAEIRVKREPGTVVVDSLLPPADFQERPELEWLRSFWSDETGAGVLALTGMGGSGKTALVGRFLQELPRSGLNHDVVSKNEHLPAPDGVFTWSFYDQPNIELFMRALFTYLTGQKIVNRPARDLTYRIIRGMEHSTYERLLLVLDGLETVQEKQGSPGGYGLLRDSSLRHLVRRVAHGDLGIRLLTTSRFPFPDLSRFQGEGYARLEVDHLPPASARRLLRARGVEGSDSELDGLIQAYGRHALTLDHLGTLLHDFFDGDPRGARELPAPTETKAIESGSEPKTQWQQLARIFAFYRQHLPPEEHRVLQVLSVFGRPVLMSAVVAVLVPDETDKARSRPR